MSLVKKRTARIPRLKSSISDEQRYEASIKLILKKAKKFVRKHVDPLLESIVQSVEVRVDAESNTIKTALGKVRSSFDNEITNRDYTRTAKDSALRVNATNALNHVTMMKAVIGVDPVKFEPWLNEEINLFVQNNVSLIKTLPSEAFSDIEQMLYRDARRGLSPTELKKQIKLLFDATDKRAALIARDQVNKFNGSLTELRQKNAGITEYEWLTSKDSRVRDDHKRLDGTIQSWNKPPITVTTGKRSGERNHPGADIQCFPFSSKVSVISDVEGASRYYFTGELSSVITFENKLVEATPNHPILTRRGWVAIKDIKVGDYLVEVVGKNFNAGEIENNDIVSTIGEIFTSINENGVFESSNGVHANFHGDVPKGDVDTIFSARSLTADGVTDSLQPVNDFFLANSDEPLSAISDFDKSFISYLAAFNGGVSRFYSIHSLFFSHLRHACDICFRGIANTYSVINKFCFNAFSSESNSFVYRKNAFPINVIFGNLFNINCNIVMWLNSFFVADNKSFCSNFFTKTVRAYRKLSRNRNKCSSRLYKFSRVDNVGTRKFDGHVYNLSTVKGWYAVNNIVSHNCRCQAIPVLPKAKK